MVRGQVTLFIAVLFPYKTLLHIVSLHTGVYTGTSETVLRVTMHPIQGYRNRILIKPRLCGSLRLVVRLYLLWEIFGQLPTKFDEQIQMPWLQRPEDKIGFIENGKFGENDRFETSGKVLSLCHARQSCFRLALLLEISLRHNSKVCRSTYHVHILKFLPCSLSSYLYEPVFL